MTIRRDPQLLKGVLPMLILAELAKEATYGRDLVQRLEGFGLEDLSHGTVYPLLTRLEREGLVDYSLVASPSGPARKIYSVTTSGTEKLKESMAAWRSLGEVVDAILA
jgi:PadR family transcriptional regulator PadR